MSAFRDVLSRLAQFLGGRNPSSPTGGSDLVELDPASDEFDDFLASVGSTDSGEDPSETALRMKDGQIAELRDNLAKMRGVADTLAETQRARLAAEARVAELETQLPGAGPAGEPGQEGQVAGLKRRVDQLKKNLARQKQSNAKLRERLEAARKKVEERHRVAAERWHELRRMGRERRELEERLRSQDRQLDEVKGLLPALAATAPPSTEGVVSRLAELMAEEFASSIQSEELTAAELADAERADAERADRNA